MTNPHRPPNCSFLDCNSPATRYYFILRHSESSILLARCEHHTFLESSEDPSIAVSLEEFIVYSVLSS